MDDFLLSIQFCAYGVAVAKRMRCKKCDESEQSEKRKAKNFMTSEI